MTGRDLGLPRELIDIANIALANNWRIEKTTANHTIWFPPDKSKGCVTVSSYKSSRGGRKGVNMRIKNITRDLRRAGLAI